MSQARNMIQSDLEVDQQDLSELNKLVSLLADLDIIDRPKKPLADINAQLSTELNPASIAILESGEPVLTEAEAIAVPIYKDEPPKPPSCPSPVAQSPTLPEDPVQALEALQTLLLGPELAQLHNSAGDLKHQVSELQRQIYDPTELMNLILPWVAELLTRKIQDSEQDMVEAIAPIIDRIIQDRTQQDQARMSHAIAPAITPAIYEQVRLLPEEMAIAIAPSVGRALQEQVKIESDAVVEALYPIIGGTISKYMAETLKAINTQIEDAISPKGIQRKIRAKLQGVSEAELVLKEAIPFTVQAIFLIQKASGLVIAEVQRADEQRLEADMIGGMLTAIRSFANDCVSRTDATSELNEIDYGMSKIILEVAGYCYLAIVVQGEPPPTFIQQVRQTLITLLQQTGDTIAKFEGDLSTLPDSIPIQLQELMHVQLQPGAASSKKISPLMLIGCGLLSAIALPWGFFSYRGMVHYQAETAATTALASVPELAVYRLSATVDQGNLKLTREVPNTLLRQKAEKIAHGAVPNWTLKNEILAVDVPPDPILTEAEVNRTTKMLNQMEGVAITTRYNAGNLDINGTVSKPADAHAIAHSFEQIPGVKTVSSAVEVQPVRIDTRFYFEPTLATVSPADRGFKAQQAIAFLQQHPKKNLKLVGYSNPQSDELETQALAVERAKAVRDLLIQQGAAPSRLQVSGSVQFPLGVDAAQSNWLRRCVVLVPV
jgi:outer membrane protein OmpA-like peptidoglycan-associated protein